MGTATGESGASAIALVQGYANEYTFPAQVTILGYLNRGLTRTVAAIGGIKRWAPLFTVANQTTIQMPADIQEIVSANFSTSPTPSVCPPFEQGAVVYPLDIEEQGSFMDFAAGFPASGFGPPTRLFIFQDNNWSSANTLPPPLCPVITSVSGTGSLAPVYVVITYTNPYGETTQSTSSTYTPTLTTLVPSVSTPQSYWNSSGFNVYASASSTGPFYLQNTTGAVAMGLSFTIPFPLVTGTLQPPTVNTATGAGTGGSIQAQLYPAAMIGSVNVYYRARPQQWADTSTTSWTDLDESFQEAAIIWATARVLESRGRAGEAKEIWWPQYNDLVADMRSEINRRTVARSGQIRDVTYRNLTAGPSWMR